VVLHGASGAQHDLWGTHVNQAIQDDSSSDERLYERTGGVSRIDGATMNDTTTALPPDLAVILDRHGVAPTVDALLFAFERRDMWSSVSGPDQRRGPYVRWYAQFSSRPPTFKPSGGVFGPTALAALARAFAVLVGEDE
jgi:hypothetical protein